MTTLKPIRTTARTTAHAGRSVLSALRTFSGLAVLLVAVFFVILNDGAGGTSSSPAPEIAPQVSAVSPRFTVTPLLMFYLVATQAEADLVAAEEYENWASGDRGASERRVHILFTRDPVEEAAAHQVILREIAAARTPTVVTVQDRRGSDGPASVHLAAGGAQ
jgi:hypothetical protein